MRRLLVTGARGFIGRHVVPLATQKYEVHAVSSSVQPDGPFVTWHRADLLDPGQVTRLLQATRPTHLLHLAWYTEHGVYWNSPVNLSWTAATLDLLQAFHGAGGQRFVGAGTCAEYSLGADPVIEGVTPERPASLYGECKLATGRIAVRFGQLTGLQVAWARLFYLFGPGEPQSRFVPSLVAGLVGGVATECRHPEYLRDYMFVRDVAAALLAVVDGNVTGQINIASGNPLQLGQFATLFGERAGRPELVRLRTPPIEATEPLSVVADVTRLNSEVGWRPAVPLVDAADETIAWWADRVRKR